MKKWLGFFHSWLLPVLLLITCFGVSVDTILMSSSQNDYHRLRIKPKNQLITKNSFDNRREPLLYVSTFDGKLFAISYQTGEVVWRVTNKFKMFVEAEYHRSNFNDDIYFSKNDRLSDDSNKNISSSKYHTNYTVENEYIVPSIDGTLYQFKNNQYRIVTDAKKNFLDDSNSTTSSNYIRSTSTLKLIGVEPWSGEVIYECNGADCSYPQFKDSDSSKKHHNHHMTANKKSSLTSQHLLVIESQMYHRFNTNLKYGFVNWNMSHNNIKLRYIDGSEKLDFYEDVKKNSATNDNPSHTGEHTFIRLENSDDLNKNERIIINPIIERESNHRNNLTNNVLKYIRYDALHDVLENAHTQWKLHMNSPVVGLWSLSESDGLVEHSLRHLIEIPYINDVLSGFSKNKQRCCDHSLLLFSFKGQPYFVPIVGNQEEHTNNHHHHPPSKPYCASIYNIAEYTLEDLQEFENNDLSTYDIKALGFFDAFEPIEKVSVESANNFQVYDQDHYFYKLKSYGSFDRMDIGSSSSSLSNAENNDNNLQLLPAPYNHSTTGDIPADDGWTFFFNNTIPYYYGRMAFLVRNFCAIGSLITAFYNTLYFLVRTIFGHFSMLPESSPLTNRTGSSPSDVEGGAELGDFAYAGEQKDGDQKSEVLDPGGISQKPSSESVTANLTSQTPPQPTPPSRYMSDFKHIRKLGKGGFGHVYMAKNLIDECEYAIKRIRMPECSTARTRVMREVQALAKLNHPGVVRFYNAWFEPTITTFDHLTNKQKNIPLCPTLHDDSELSLCSEDECSEHVFSSNVSKDTKRNKPPTSFIDYNNPFVIPEDMIPSVSSTSVSQSADSYPASCKESECRTAEHLSVSCTHNLSTDLYIQMQLCQSQTLHDWLETNTTERNISACINYFKQILMAIGYIHSQDFIHRDLKPSNIFFSMDGIVKIGDFGLVAHTLPTPKSHEPTAKHHVKKSKSTRISVSACSENLNLHYYTRLVGTELYMAPEQSNCEKYDNTVDIYALALILTELVLPFKTQTERYITLNNMKQLKKNAELAEKYPKVAVLVEWMLAVDPKNRPTAIDIIDSGLIQSLWDKYGLANI